MIAIAIALTVHAAVIAAGYLLTGVAIWVICKLIGFDYSPRLILIWPCLLFMALFVVVFVHSIISYPDIKAMKDEDGKWGDETCGGGGE